MILTKPVLKVTIRAEEVKAMPTYDDIAREVNNLPDNEVDRCQSTALELLVHEFRTLSERNNAFLVVQTIFIGAVGVVLTQLLRSISTPFGLEETVEFWIIIIISLIGIIFCTAHQNSARNGAEQANFWRNYLRALEQRKRTNNGVGQPWTVLFNLRNYILDKPNIMCYAYYR